jgi:hypothetical protein
MILLWLGYLVYSLGNCVMKLCIETNLTYDGHVASDRAPVLIGWYLSWKAPAPEHESGVEYFTLMLAKVVVNG